MNQLLQAEMEGLRRAVQAHQAGNIDLFLEQESREKDMKRKLENYLPYPKHRAFHKAGALYRERMIMGPKQVGKTLPAAAETAMHLTGRYPERCEAFPNGWEGKRFDRPVAWAVASETGKLTRDGALFGVPKYPRGSGMVPEECIVSTPVGSSLTGC